MSLAAQQRDRSWPRHRCFSHCVRRAGIGGARSAHAHPGGTSVLQRMGRHVRQGQIPHARRACACGAACENAAAERTARVARSSAPRHRRTRASRVRSLRPWRVPTPIKRMTFCGTVLRHVVTARTPPVVKVATHRAGSFAAESGLHARHCCPATRLSKPAGSGYRESREENATGCSTT